MPGVTKYGPHLVSVITIFGFWEKKGPDWGGAFTGGGSLKQICQSTETEGQRQYRWDPRGPSAMQHSYAPLERGGGEETSGIDMLWR